MQNFHTWEENADSLTEKRAVIFFFSTNNKTVATITLIEGKKVNSFRKDCDMMFKFLNILAKRA